MVDRGHMPPSDEALARAAQAGSVQAFGELVDRYERRIIGFLSRRTGWSADAEDLAQETFLRAWAGLSRYRDEYRFSTWLFTIAARLGADHIRGSRRAQKTIDAGRAVASRRESGSMGVPGAGERAAGRDGADAVWTVAERVLTPEQLSALWLRYMGEMGIPEIASVLGRSEVGVRVLLFRARQRIARELPDRRGVQDAGPEPSKIETDEPRRLAPRTAAAEGARC